MGFHIHHIVLFLKDNHHSSFLFLQDDNLIIISEFFEGPVFLIGNAGFGGLAFLRVRAQFCRTSLGFFLGRYLIINYMMQMISSTGIFLGAITKLRPFSTSVQEEVLISMLESLTTCRLGSLDLVLD